MNPEQPPARAYKPENIWIWGMKMIKKRVDIWGEDTLRKHNIERHLALALDQCLKLPAMLVP